MENIALEATAKTPEVNFNSEASELTIKGRSIPENSIEFYKPLMDWISDYLKLSPTKTTLHIQLEYFNTSTSKCLLDLFKALEPLSKNGKELIINWYCDADDEDMMEAGEDYEAITSLKFNVMTL